MQIEILFTIIVGQLFARPDRSPGENIYATIANSDLAIRRAGVIDKAGRILRNVAVDHTRGACPEKVLPAIFLDLFVCRGAPEVLDDERTLCYALFGEQAPSTV